MKPLTVIEKLEIPAKSADIITWLSYYAEQDGRHIVESLNINKTGTHQRISFWWDFPSPIRKEQRVMWAWGDVVESNNAAEIIDLRLKQPPQWALDFLKITLEEWFEFKGRALIRWFDKVLEKLKEKTAEANVQPESKAEEKAKPETEKKSNQKGRYRLTPDQIKERKKVVKDANKRKKNDPRKTWKEIAYEMDIPVRTLNDWRLNY